MFVVYNDKRLVTYSKSDFNKNFLSDYLLDIKLYDEALRLSDTKNQTVILVQNKKENQDFHIFVNNIVKQEDLIELHDMDLIEVKNGSRSFYILYIENINECRAISLKNLKSISIGRGLDNDIIINHIGVSRKHAEIYRTENKVKITKTTQNGFLYVNHLATEASYLNVGDCVSVLNCQIVYLEGIFLIFGKHKISTKLEEVKSFNPFCKQIENWEYSGTPRILYDLVKENIRIDPPTALNKAKPMPFVLSVGPSLTMALAMLVSLGIGVGNVLENGVDASFVTSLTMAAAMLAGAVLWPALTRKYQKKEEQKEETIRNESYRKYLAKKENEILELYKRNADVLEKHLFPTPSKLLNSFEEKKLPLFFWERKIEDPDFLSVRLGLGSVLSEVKAQTMEERFTVEQDDLQSLANEIAKHYRYHYDAPIGFSLLNSRMIGVFGNTRTVKQIVNAIWLNIVTLHSPNDVKTVALYSSVYDDNIQTMYSDLPHTWENEKNIHYISYNPNQATKLLTNIYVEFCEATVNKTESFPHYVIFAYDKEEVQKSALYHAVKENPDKFYASFVFPVHDYAELPVDCQTIVQAIQNNCGIYEKGLNDKNFCPFEIDEIETSKLQKTMANMLHVKIPTSNIQTAVPKQVGFLDMFKVGNIEKLQIEHRWFSNCSEQSLSTPIGVVENNEILYFDIHESAHGCHGIVAGTTGSGKSEFLQAYILSMMVNYSPDDVSFVLVDFKGGDIAIPFQGIAHVSSVISNLTEKILHRAIVSLYAEKNKRQILFSKTADALGLPKVDINSYQKLYKQGKVQGKIPNTEAIPHLIIIMDEFAQFKTQHSEYMQDLIDIAQIGRSLGIHLILATQKPAGVVDGQIWSNSRFKFCLKVLEREDSKALLQRDEAAFIKNPGRAYMQVGYNEVFAQFQSGYCRAKYIPRNEYIDANDITVRMVDGSGEVLAEEIDVDEIVKKEAPTQIDAITADIKRVCAKYGFTRHALWEEPLGNYLYAEDCSVQSDTVICKIPFGYMDIPSKKQQKWYVHDFVNDGNIALYGASGSGKTTLIQSILYQATEKYNPKQFKYAVLDMNGKNYSMFDQTKYSIGIASEQDEDSVDELLSALEQEIVYRKAHFADCGCNSYLEYCASSTQELPIVFVVLENYGKFREYGYQYEERFVNIVGGGQTYGFCFVITSNSKSGIHYKVQEQIATTIVFHMFDAESYRDLLGVQIATLPENVKGRALILYEGEAVEMQVALPVKNQSEAERMSIMREYLNTMRITTKSVKKTKSENHKQDTVTMPFASATPSTKKQKFLLYHEDDAVLPIFIGYDTEHYQKAYFDGAKYRRCFVCCREPMHTDVFSEEMYTNVSGVRLISFFGNENSFEESILLNIERALNNDDTPILFIPDFANFYQNISNDNYRLFFRYLKEHPEISVLTFAVLGELSDYASTDLHIELCRKADITMIQGGLLNESQLTLFNDQLDNVDKQLLFQKIKAHQMLVFSNDGYALTYSRENENG